MAGRYDDVSGVYYKVKQRLVDVGGVWKKVSARYADVSGVWYKTYTGVPGWSSSLSTSDGSTSVSNTNDTLSADFYPSETGYTTVLTIATYTFSEPFTMQIGDTFNMDVSANLEAGSIKRTVSFYLYLNSTTPDYTLSVTTDVGDKSGIYTLTKAITVSSIIVHLSSSVSTSNYCFGSGNLKVNATGIDPFWLKGNN